MSQKFDMHKDGILCSIGTYMILPMRETAEKSKVNLFATEICIPFMSLHLLCYKSYALIVQQCWTSNLEILVISR